MLRIDYMFCVVILYVCRQVLENCSKVLDNLCNEEYAISGKCNVARSTLVDSLVEKYKEAFQDFFQEVRFLLSILLIQYFIKSACAGDYKNLGAFFSLFLSCVIM